MSTVLMKRFVRPYLWPDSIFQRTQGGKEHNDTLRILHGFTKRIIHERLKETPVLSNGVSGDVVGRRKKIAFLDLLLKMHREDPSFTLEDIQEEVDTFMFEGHDTTAAGVSWALFMLGRNADVQTRLHEELDQVFGKSEKPVTSEDLSKLPYLNRVVKEALRIIPSVQAVDRELHRDIVLDGKVVPKGTMISMNIYALHQDPQYFPNPEQFDPDRFLPENVNTRHPFAYIPFLAGSRNCIGQRFAMMEEKVVVANFLRQYSIQSLEDAKPEPLMITRPLDGKLWVKLTSRK